MSALQRPLTYDDLQEMPDDGKRREVLGGELIVTPAPNPGHQRVLRSLFRLIDDYSIAAQAGEVFFAPIDVLLDRFDIVQPDLVFLSSARARVPNAQPGVVDAPDLVVEVVSPSSGGTDRVRKMALYARSGVTEYWIADPMQRSLDCYALAGDDYQEIVPDAEGRMASRVLPGLVVDPTTVFSVLD